ncbi:unnamed protein product, partial [Amoebophrya sp. A25]|eukprot:GSA25T00008887001.1
MEQSVLTDVEGSYAPSMHSALDVPLASQLLTAGFDVKSRHLAKLDPRNLLPMRKY